MHLLHMAVEMIIDQWNPEKRKYRTETFCHGPKSCPCTAPARSASFLAARA
jgi:hypothetical protein